ncbi:MAG TPA: methyltransferase domain-containing protein [Oligoflexia bacterium]|nr:methyltransferase domain-containing protein [Oligoflexia bacterium]HMP48943.1 methyltransferase domain-containing protein [Oligoflexia bacterium]
MSQAVKDHALEFLSNDEALEIEDSLWWVQGRKAIIRNYLKIALSDNFLFDSGINRMPKLMDVGCGSGGSFDVLSEFGSVLGVEPSSVLANRARNRGIATSVFEKSVHDLEEVKEVNIFTLFDVLEHIEDDHSFMKGINDKALQAHRVLVSVPACPALYSEHDRLLHHYRRYTKPMLRATLENSGYEVELISYHMSLLFPVAVAVRLLEKIKALLGKKSDTVEIGDAGPIISPILKSALTLESHLVSKISLPIGLWLFALARRK